MWEKLKKRWGLKNNWSVLVVLIVFSVTGSVAVRVAKPLLELIGVSDAINPWIYWPIRIFVIFPTYQVLLLIFGYLSGQWTFFSTFQKKMLSRFGIKF